MSNQSNVRQFLRAVLHELYRSKTAYNLIAIVVLLSMIILGYVWRESYVSSAIIATLQKEHRNDNTAEISQDLAKHLNDLLRSQEFVDTVTPLLLDVNPQILGSTQDLDLASLFSIVRQDAHRVMLSFFSSSPEIARDSLRITINALITSVVPKDEIEYFDDVLEQISIQEEVLKTKLAEQEARMEAYQSGEANEDAQRARQRISSLNESIQDVEVELDAVVAKTERIRHELNNEELIQSDKRQLAQLRSQKSKLVEALGEKTETYGEFASEVISVQQELDEVNAQIYELTENTVLYSEQKSDDSLYAKLRKQLTLEELEKDALVGRRDSLVKLLKSAQTKVTLSESKLEEFTLSKKDYELTLADYESLVKKKDANLAKQRRLMDSTTHYQIIEGPSLAKKYRGIGFIEFAVFGPIAALLLPLILASFIVLLDSRIRTRNQLKKGLPEGVVIIGSVPHYDSPQTSRLFRRAIAGALVWGLVVFSAYFAFGYVGLRN